MNRQERRAHERAQKRGSKTQKRRRRPPGWLKDTRDARADELAEMKHRLYRLLDEKLRATSESDGVLAAPMGLMADVAAEAATAYIVEQLMPEAGLDPEEHRATLEIWILNRLGNVARYPDLKAYFTWREDCQRRAVEAQQQRQRNSEDENSVEHDFAGHGSDLADGAGAGSGRDPALQS